MAATVTVEKPLKRKNNRGRPSGPWVTARKVTQYLALLTFLGLFVVSRQGGPAGSVINLPMRLDPLLWLGNILASRAILAGSAIALLTVLLTVIFGRAWCGWLCPLGTVLDIFPLRRTRGKRPAPAEKWRSVKYVLLLMILMAALLGNLTLLFLDPLAILFRTLSTAVWPALDQVVTSLETVLYPVSGLDGLLSSLDTWLRPGLLPYEPVYYRDGLLFAGLFLGLVLLNIFAPRFWCRYLCPLGGLLGWISRVALFRRTVSGECTGCLLCTQNCPTGTIDPARNYASDPAECTMCMDCLETCPKSHVSFRPRISLGDGMAYDPGRREALLAMGAAICSVALFRSDLRAKREPSFLLRPPGARENNPDVIALTRCTRCNECIRACPTSGLQPAVWEAGAEGVGTPVLLPRLGYCDYSCQACGQVCPVQAIPALSLDEKRLQVIGKAYIDESRCIAWSDHQPCVVCEEMCPLPEKAIQLEQQQVWGPGNVPVTIQLPHVLRESCIGCGICEYKCPVSGEAAIRVYVPQMEVSF
ncbi:MAG: 4Fe-4S binding protein [Bacteroidota bacterium]